jgi:hypothetical protein
VTAAGVGASGKGIVSGSEAQREASKVAGDGGSSRLKAMPRTSMLSPPWPEGIRSFVRFAPRELLRYQTYREGLIPDKEIIFRVEGGVDPDRFTVSVSPGDRTFTWVIDPTENAFYQEFRLPDPKTGELGVPRRTLRLQLPRPSSVVDRNYMAGNLKIHAQPVDLVVPPQGPQRPQTLFRECLCVESREGDRIRCEYFQEGRGLVAVIIFAPKEQLLGSQKGLPGGAVSEGAFKPPTPPTEGRGGDSKGEAADGYAIAYASFFVERIPED